MHTEFELDLKSIVLGGVAVQTWFLPAIIIWQIVVYFAMKLYKNCYIDLALMIISFAVGHYFSQAKDISLTMFCMSIYTGYIFAAAFLWKKRIIISTTRPVIMSLTMIAALILYLFCKTYVTGIFWSLSVFTFFLVYPFKPNRYVDFISSNSFGVYLIHFVFLQLGVIAGQVLHWNTSTIAFGLSNIFIAFSASLLVSSMFRQNRILKHFV